MATYPDRIPTGFSERLATTAATILARQGREYDVALGGIPFMLATSSDLPRSIETIPLRKDQFDAENDPGEQTLSGWWRRSQDSWHEGAGNLYQESRADTNPNSGFFDSMGVEVFTKGQLSLLRGLVNTNASTGFSRLRAYVSAGVTGLSAAKGASGFYKTGTLSGALAALHTPASKTIVDGFVAGSSFYDVASDGTFYEGTIASPGTATSWPLGAAVTRLEWGKGRPWLIGGRAIWQPDLTLAAGTAQPAIFTNPNAGWTYTAIAEAGAGMLFAGHDGRTSSIQLVGLDSSGGVPTISGAQTVATFPDGELVQEIAVLAGQFVGIGSNRGFRVGAIDGTNLSYGPLLFEPDGVTSCTAITTMGRFFLVAFDSDEPGLAYKVDTSTQLSDGVFAYAKNVCVDPLTNDTITGLATDGTSVACLATGGKVYAQGTDLVPTGWIQTGRVRFRTNERKFFKFVDLETEPMRGQIVVSGVNEVGSGFDIGVVSDQGIASNVALSITSALGPEKQIALKFTLARDSDPTLGPVMNSYLLRATPSVAPQRMHTVPLLLFDKEKARSGQVYGYDGYAVERLAALQVVENAGDIATFQDFTRNTGESVLIDSIRYVQQTAAKDFGGILILQLRTVST